MDSCGNSEAPPIHDSTPSLARQQQITSQRRPKISKSQPPKHDQPKRPELTLQLRQQVGFSHFVGGIPSSRTGQTDRRSEPSSQLSPRTFQKELNTLTKNKPPKRSVSRKPEKLQSYAFNSPPPEIRRNEPQTGVGRQRNGAPTVTTNRPVLPPVRRQKPPLRGTEDHQARTSNTNYRRNGRRHLLLTPDDRWYRPTFTKRSKSQPTSENHRSGFPQKISSQKNRAVRKTRREPNRGPTKQRRSATKSGPVQSTAENCPILPNCHTIPRHVVLLLHNTGKQQIRNYRSATTSTTNDANCSASQATKSLTPFADDRYLN